MNTNNNNNKKALENIVLQNLLRNHRIDLAENSAASVATSGSLSAAAVAVSGNDGTTWHLTYVETNVFVPHHGCRFLHLISHILFE